jgi:hypothetical protein
MMQTSAIYPLEHTASVVSPVENDVVEGAADQYGQRHPIETDEMIEAALRDFDLVLQSVPKSKKKYVLDAQCKCPELLTKSFTLMFLRCECFKVDVRLSVCYIVHA